MVKGQGLGNLKDSELNSARRRSGEDKVAPATTGEECRVGVSFSSGGWWVENLEQLGWESRDMPLAPCDLE